MTFQELVDEINQQPTWAANGQRAPHKSLALLFALGHAVHGNRLVRFNDSERVLQQLLDRFGPPRPTQHPEQPVWRLRQYQGAPTTFWELHGDVEGIERAGGNPSLPLLRERISFGLSEAAWSTISGDPSHISALAVLLANEIVPPTLHPALWEAVGLDPPADSFAPQDASSTVAAAVALIERRRVTTTRIHRDPAFSRKVFAAYEGACAICSISPKIGTDRFGLEAAHIRWARYEGPDVVPNGLCLCKMHHEALDWGALKVDDAMKVRVSTRLDTSEESMAMFGRYEGQEIRLPRSNTDRPSDAMLNWHWTEVFKP